MRLRVENIEFLAQAQLGAEGLLGVRDVLGGRPRAGVEAGDDEDGLLLLEDGGLVLGYFGFEVLGGHKVYFDVKY